MAEDSPLSPEHTQIPIGAGARTSPVLTVTVTNHNYARFLPRNLDSVLSQTFTDFELLVIDNASTDDSMAVLQDYARRDPRVRIIAHEKNVGALASLRESCDLARGRYRVHVDADDWVLSATAFETQVDFLETNHEASFVYSSMTMYGPDDTKTYVSRPYAGDLVLPGEQALEALLGFNLTHSGMMIRLESYRRTKGYPETYVHVADMLLAVRLAEVGHVGYLDRELYAFRQHDQNLHNDPERRVIRDEILPVVAEALSGPLADRMQNPETVRRRVTRTALVHLPTQYIFGGQATKGWRFYLESLKARPALTLLQPRTLSLTARTLLGRRGYAQATARVARPLRNLATTIARKRRPETHLDVAFIGFLFGHGGDAIQMLDLAKGLHDLGRRVKVFVPCVAESEHFAARAASMGVPCERTSSIAVRVGGCRQNPIALARFLRRIDAEHVHLHTGNSCLPRAAMLVLLVARRRNCIATIQSPYETLTPGTFRARSWVAMARRVMAAVVSPSQRASAYQVRLGMPRSLVVTIPNNVDLKAIPNADGRGPRAELGLTPDDPLVLFCSRIDEQKRPVEALHMFASVAEEFPSAILAYVGQGSLEDAVQREATRLGIADRVRLVGYRTDVADWLAASTVWLLPTERENFSLALLEAMAAGCAIASTWSPGNDEVLRDCENALTFPVGDIDAGSIALRELLANPGLRARLGQSARRDAESYSTERMVDAYAELYNRFGRQRVG